MGLATVKLKIIALTGRMAYGHGIAIDPALAQLRGRTLTHKKQFRKRFVRVLFAALALLITSTVAVPRATAGSGPTIFFLGTKDDNKVGAINGSDRTRLFAILQGSPAVQISGDQESVVTYAVSSDLSKVAYAVDDSNKLSVQIAQTAQPKSAPVHVDLADLTNIRKLEFFGGTVWVMGTNGQAKPAILGIDVAQCKIIVQRAMHQ